MTKQTKDVPPKVIEDKPTPPTPAIVPASEAVSSAETGFDAVAFEERIAAQLEEFKSSLPEQIDARFKSTTDKSFQDVRKVAQYLKKFDGNEELAVREMAIDRLLEEQETEVGDPGRSPAQSTQMSKAEEETFKAETAEILEEAGIPLDDPEVIELAKKAVTSKDDYFRELGILGIKRAKQGGVTASAIVGSEGRVITPVEGDALLAEITELQESPVINAKLIKEKMAQAREAGLLP